MKLISVRFLRDGKPFGNNYTYFKSDAVTLNVGDYTLVPTGINNALSVAVVTKVDVPEHTISSFRNMVKTIDKPALTAEEIKERGLI
jgi:hypothetical protein